MLKIVYKIVFCVVLLISCCIALLFFRESRIVSKSNSRCSPPVSDSTVFNLANNFQLRWTEVLESDSLIKNSHFKDFEEVYNDSLLPTLRGFRLCDEGIFWEFLRYDSLLHEVHYFGVVVSGYENKLSYNFWEIDIQGVRHGNTKALTRNIHMEDLLRITGEFDTIPCRYLDPIGYENTKGMDWLRMSCWSIQNGIENYPVLVYPGLTSLSLTLSLKPTLSQDESECEEFLNTLWHYYVGFGTGSPF